MTGYYSQDDMIHEVDLREELDECIAELDSDDAEYAWRRLDRRCWRYWSQVRRFSLISHKNLMLFSKRRLQFVSYPVK